jgi:uncharacterized membrane protein YdjX (TVP38/TMEM64 family)
MNIRVVRGNGSPPQAGRLATVVSERLTACRRSARHAGRRRYRSIAYAEQHSDYPSHVDSCDDKLVPDRLTHEHPDGTNVAPNAPCPSGRRSKACRKFSTFCSQPTSPCAPRTVRPFRIPAGLPLRRHQDKFLYGASTLSVLLLSPSAAHAAESAPDGFFETVLRIVESLGPFGPAAFALAVATCECIPLFPTQPLSLASGLLFGAGKGAVAMLAGTTLAAMIAFTVARGVGRPLAERIIRAEMVQEGASDSSDSDKFAGEPVGPVQAKLLEVQEAIERGSFMQQASAILVLRLTPIVPFSASNYVLGLSPVPLAPYLAGTVAGMSFWSALYASLGGASRALLRRGADPDVLLADLLNKAGNLTGQAGVAAAVAGGVGMLAYTAVSLRQRQEVTDNGGAMASSDGVAAVGDLRQEGGELVEPGVKD